MSAGSASAANAGKGWVRQDWLIAAGLFAATFLSRIPFRTTLFYAWDSVLYARALEHFDVSLEQPHPPGHIFYVYLSRLVNTMIEDPNAALVWVSVFFSAASVAALYWLGRLMFGRAAGLVAALLLATSLSFWAYSEVAYPYTLLAFLGIITAGLIFLERDRRSAGCLLAAGLFIGLGSGFRQDLLPFMLPLLVYGLIGAPWRRIAATLGLVLAGVVAWYVPTVLLSGGLSQYQAVSSSQSDYIMQFNSVFGRGLPAIIDNISDVGRFSLVATVAAIPLLAYFAVRVLLPSGRTLRTDRRLILLLLWLLPSLLFFIFMHVGEFGYVFIYLPALLLAAAWGAQLLAGDLAARGGRRRSTTRFVTAVGALAICANLLLFLVLTPTLSANRLAARDGILRSRLDTIQADLDPRTTFIVSVFDYQQAAWYLPQYDVWHFDPRVDEQPRVELPAGTRSVVIFEEYLKPAAGTEADSIPLAYDQEMRVMHPAGHRYLSVDWPSRTVDFAD